MKLAMTLMVRDEADIVGAMLDHHLGQGVDIIIVTDNGSVDGTAEILQSYADRGLIDLRHDPVQRKQQGETVTRMARDAYLSHGADWVINADADEFWVAADRGLTVREAFERIPKALGAFTVPVFDMTGAPALDGTGLGRLTYKDLRPIDRLHEIGLLSHSTHDAAHIGAADVTVSQGNHFVSIESAGQPDASAALEVLHFPWRSWAQYGRKVENAGRSYENSELTPSPNHHGMRDYRRLQAGSLFAFYVARHPDQAELERGLASGAFVYDDTMASVSNPVPDVDVPEVSASAHRSLGEVIARLENENRELTITRDTHSYDLGVARLERDWAHTTIAELRDTLTQKEAVIADLRARRSVRVVDAITERGRALFHRG